MPSIVSPPFPYAKVPRALASHPVREPYSFDCRQLSCPPQAEDDGESKPLLPPHHGPLSAGRSYLIGVLRWECLQLGLDFSRDYWEGVNSLGIMPYRLRSLVLEADGDWLDSVWGKTKSGASARGVFLLYEELKASGLTNEGTGLDASIELVRASVTKHIEDAVLEESAAERAEHLLVSSFSPSNLRDTY